MITFVKHFYTVKFLLSCCLNDVVLLTKTVRMAKLHILKFGGSSLCSSERLHAVSCIISQQKCNVILVLSAMGRTTSVLIDAAKLASQGNRVQLNELRELHLGTLRKLGVDSDTSAYKEVESLLASCETVLYGLSLIKSLSPLTLDLVMSFGERMSVRVFAAYLNKLGIKAEPLETPEIGSVYKTKVVIKAFVRLDS